MQVNSAQDWLTAKKRQIVAKTYHTIPPPQTKRYNYVFLSAIANGATQRQRFIVPPNPGIGNVTRAAFSSECCLSNGNTASPGVFSATTSKGVVRLNLLQPMSITATRTTASG